MKSKIYIGLLLVIFCSHSFGASFTGTIQKIVCHEQSTASACQIQVNGEAPTASCATQAWKYTFDGTTPEGKNMLSILLAAQVAKQQVTIGGKGVCTISSTSEDVRHVYITTTE